MLKEMPDYNNPTRGKLLDLINEQAQQVQLIEIFERLGEFDEVRTLKFEKHLTNIRRICIKAALKQKEKADARSKHTA